MEYLQLFLSFFKIGLFSFGGGYAMIPLIQKEIEMHRWLTSSEFIDIIAIAEMTPGPIAVNSATFVGYKAAGLPGSVFATVGVALPSAILIIAVSGLFFKLRNNPVKIMIFYCIRPVVVGLIASAAIFVAVAAFSERSFDLRGISILALSLAALTKFKINPILVIAGAGIAGVALYGLIPV